MGELICLIEFILNSFTFHNHKIDITTKIFGGLWWRAQQ